MNSLTASLPTKSQYKVVKAKKAQAHNRKCFMNLVFMRTSRIYTMYYYTGGNLPFLMLKKRKKEMLKSVKKKNLLFEN